MLQADGCRPKGALVERQQPRDHRPDHVIEHFARHRRATREEELGASADVWADGRFTPIGNAGLGPSIPVRADASGHVWVDLAAFPVVDHIPVGVERFETAPEPLPDDVPPAASELTPDGNPWREIAFDV